MHISRFKCMIKYYELCNQALTTVSHAKYLGITLSSDLRWHRHVCDVAKKANSILHLNSRNLRSCPIAARIIAYTTRLRPKREYSSAVWDPHTKEYINILERANWRAASIVFNKNLGDSKTSAPQPSLKNSVGSGSTNGDSSTREKGKPVTQ